MFTSVTKTTHTDFWPIGRHNTSVWMKLVCVTFLLLSACSSADSTNLSELDELKAEVAELPAELKTFSIIEKASQQVGAWPADYQERWAQICFMLLKDLAESDPLASPAKAICKCTLQGLMEAFALGDYDSWPQNVKDDAAAPYVYRCWKI
jgi:hypothetical protein